MHLQLSQSLANTFKFPIKQYSALLFKDSVFAKRLFSLPLKALMAIVMALLLNGCSSTPVSVEERDLERSTTITADRQAPTLESKNRPARDSNYERAEYYGRLSKLPAEDLDGDTTDEDSQLTAALNAAEHYIQANDYQRAEQILKPHLNRPLGQQMTKQQSDRTDVVMAYIAYSRKQYNNALIKLNNVLDRSWAINQPTESNRDPALPSGQVSALRKNLGQSSAPLTVQQIDALLLSSLCHQALGNYNSAIANLLKRESGLAGEARAETTRYTWQIINELEVEQRLAIIDSTSDARVRNRLEQSLQGQFGQQIARPQQFSQWREQTNLRNQEVILEQWSSESAKRVAVLLPLSSRFAKAAQALMDGIKYAHEQNTGNIAPQVSFYDIGDSPFQVAQHYAAAVNGGADFIIGPLGKDYANRLNSILFNSQTSQPPTILLGGDTALRGATHRLTLSPESNGERVARKAYQDGHLNMALLMSSSNNSQRVADAFSRTWLNLGGKISNTVRYSPERFDHSAELKQLFGIYESETRHSKLSGTLGYKPKFSAYKRPDIDFVFMIADNAVGRIIRPQINFYGGVRMPVYSDSTIFNGIQNNTENLDLEQTRFPVMPWVLRSANVAPYAGQLNQLYALGIDTYRLAGNYARMKNNPNLAINGSTGQLNIKRNGVIDFQPIWASFQEGEVIATDTLGIDVNPLQLSADEALPTNGLQRSRSGQNRTGNNKTSYDDSNWNTRESSRKTRP